MQEGEALKTSLSRRSTAMTATRSNVVGTIAAAEPVPEVDGKLALQEHFYFAPAPLRAQSAAVRS